MDEKEIEGWGIVCDSFSVCFVCGRSRVVVQHPTGLLLSFISIKENGRRTMDQQRDLGSVGLCLSVTEPERV